jgi:general secretion pathway protein J
VTAARGFTLIELLIGISLSALIMVLLVTALGTNIRAWEGALAGADAVEARRAADRYLRRALAGALPYRYYDGRRLVTAFSGTPKRISFAAVIGAPRVLPGIYVVTLAVEPADRGERLVLRERLARPQIDFDTATDGAEALPIITDPAGIEFGYFGSAARNAAPDWHDEWPANAGAPDLVRVAFAGRDADPLYLPVPAAGAALAPPIYGGQATGENR